MPEPIRCGRWTLSRDGADIRSLAAAGTELISHLYPTVRDRDWNTVAPTVFVVDEEVRDDRVGLRIEARNRAGEIDLSWHGAIELAADGAFSYELTGVANADFDYCRIGFCLLLDAGAACGRPYRARTPEGVCHGALPVQVAPQLIVEGIEQALFPACEAFELDLPGGTVRAEFDGDLFELEDQRNWSDFSFKLYCTPMALGYPFRARAGQRFRQRVVVSTDIEGEGRTAGEDGPVTIALAGRPQRRRPAVGIGQSSVLDRPMTRAEAGAIALLRPDHLRADIELGMSGWMPALERAICDARAIGCGLAPAVFVASGVAAGDDALARLGALLRDVPVRRILVLDAGSHGIATTTPAQVRAVRAAVREAGVTAPVGGGTDGDFAELNRDRPEVTDLDFVAYTMNPQVHVFDDLSLIQNLPAQASTVATARSFAGTTPVVVDAVTLRQRFNPAASAVVPAADARGPDGLPPSVDARQSSLFGAAWALGSMAALTGAEADAVTYFETVGWRGVIERSEGEPEPGPFGSSPGMRYPVFHLWRDLVEGVDGDRCIPVLDVAAGVAALALPVAGGYRVVIANLRAAQREVALRSLCGERTTVALGPYAYARVDIAEAWTPTGPAR